MLTKSRKDSGQALIEFLMMMPFLLTFTWYMIHVSMAINKSVVGQQHARSQLFLKMFNHSRGPELSAFTSVARSSFFIGVAKNVIGSGPSVPQAPTETLGIGANPGVNPLANNDSGEASGGTMRQVVRIRSAFGICTHRKTLTTAVGARTDFCASTSVSGGL